MAEKVEKKREIAAVVEHCVIRLFPTGDPQTEMRITGVYISPGNTEQRTMPILEAVGMTTAGRATEEEVPHLLVGDVNTQSWGQPFAEWTNTQGLQELVDPDIPTFALGSPIDKMLVLPRFYAPSSFLPPGGSRLQDRADQWETPFCPAAVLEYLMFSGH